MRPEQTRATPTAPTPLFGDLGPGALAAAQRRGAAGSSAWRGIALQARQRLPGLWFGGWLALALSVPLAVLGWWDDRTLLGVSVWTKPWKFHVSVGLHLLTLAWFAALLQDTPDRARGFRRMSAVALSCSVIELVYITWRAARGEASHFNVGTPLAGAMYAVMGLGAVLLTACAGWLGWVTLRARDYAWGAVLQRGVGLGLLMGFVLGTLAGAYVSAQTGHHVGGTASDAQGLPLFNWSRDGGDLRVAHFFGLHAMHVLPLVAWWAGRLASPITARRALDSFALGYAVLTVGSFVQAALGRPFL